MRKLFLALLFAIPASAQQYYSNFPLTQNPISETGKWTVPGSLANQWGNVQTNGSMAFGVSLPTTFGDPTAVLNGSWNPNQLVIETVSVPGAPSGVDHEVEIRLRTSITSNSITGYEIFCNTASGAGIQEELDIVRWNGPNGQFVVIGASGPTIQCANGDVLKAYVTGTSPVNINVYRNGTLVATACDNGQGSGGSCGGFTYSGPGGAAGPWTSGSPGLGFYVAGQTDWSSFGISSFYALDTAGTILAAATCGTSDIATQVTAASAGDIILVPPGTCSWTSTLTVAKNITIMGDGMPNGSPSQFGAGTIKTIITDNVSGNPALSGQITFISSALFRVSLMDFEPSATANLQSPLQAGGTCTASGCPNIRFDNIGFGLTTAWNNSLSNQALAAWLIRAGNVFGVIDHCSENSANHPDLVDVELPSYLGVGDYGDNSWATPDTMGGANNLYIENNLIYTTQAIVDTEIKAVGVPGFGIGGGRYVARFNQHTNSGSFGSFGDHGLDTNGRPQGGRQIEVYGNVGLCISGSCGNLAGWRSATGRVFGNTLNRTGSAFFSMMGLNVYRAVYAVPVSWAACGGLNSVDPADTNDNTIPFTGTVSSETHGTGVANTMTDTGASWPNLAPAGSPYTVYNFTKGISFMAEVASNTATTLTTKIPIPESAWNSSGMFSIGDTYQIIRSTVCADQPGRGQGALVSGIPPSPASALNQALDPVYEWDNVASVLGGSTDVTTNTGRIIADRDFFSDNARGNPHVQTGVGTPFTGTTGVGFGTYANRPTTCTGSVGYWATDQGTWNSSGNTYAGGFTQGQLYICSGGVFPVVTSPAYTPYTYPHPLITGSAAAASPFASFSPSSVNVGTVPLGFTGNASGTITLTNTGTANLVVLATTIASAQFSLVNNTCGSPSTINNLNPGSGFTLIPAASCTFQAVYTPSGIFTESGSFAFSDNTASNPDIFTVVGTGTGPPAPANTIFAGNTIFQGSVTK